MDDQGHPLEDDDEPVRMTMNERSVWGYLVTVLVTSGAYLALMVTRLATEPVEQIAWVGPMLWTIGASVLGTLVLTIIGAITSTVTATIARSTTPGPRGRQGRAAVTVVTTDMVSDARDTEIDQVGDRALVGVLGAGFVGVLVLAMLDADTFWIGNLLFVFGTLGAIVETTTKIRLYRRGF